MVQTRKRKAAQSAGNDAAAPKRGKDGVNKPKDHVGKLLEKIREPAAKSIPLPEPSSNLKTKSFYKTANSPKKANSGAAHVNKWDAAAPSTSTSAPTNIPATSTTDSQSASASTNNTNTKTPTQLTNLPAAQVNPRAKYSPFVRKLNAAAITESENTVKPPQVDCSDAAITPKSAAPVSDNSQSSKGKGIPGKQSKSKSSNKKDKTPVKEAPVSVELDPSLPPYYTAVEGACSIQNISDEILLNIFCRLGTKNVFKSVNRVCKRWNKLSKDRWLWRDADFTSKSLGPTQARKVLRTFCSSEYTKSLALKAVNNRTQRKKTTTYKCLSPAVLKELKKVSQNLTSFTISHEQICKVNLYPALPTTLTHLSLPYCNISVDNFKALISSDFVLNGLKYLDLSGALVIKFEQFYISEAFNFPAKLETLKLRDVMIPVQSYNFSRLLTRTTSLKELDISLNNISIDILDELARELINLEALNMCGCLVCEEDASPTGDEDIEESEWYGMINKMKKLNRINIRNVTLNSGDLPSLLRNSPPKPRNGSLGLEMEHVIDVDGESWGDWTEEELKVVYMETWKFDHDDRVQKEHDQRMRQRWSGGWRRRGLFGFDFYDSDDYYESDSDCSVDSFGDPWRRRRRDDCSVM